MKKTIVVFSIIAVSFMANYAFATCGFCGVEAPDEHAHGVVQGTFKAEVVCLGCTLKKEQGAKAQCSVYGHKNALRTADGKIWSILENDTSTELINSDEYAGKAVEIIGKKYIDAHVIEIESFKVLEE